MNLAAGWEARLAAAPEMEKERVPGLSVAVVADGDIAGATGFGVRHAGGDEPVTPETVFAAESLSKGNTAS